MTENLLTDVKNQTKQTGCNFQIMIHLSLKTVLERSVDTDEMAHSADFLSKVQV